MSDNKTDMIIEKQKKDSVMNAVGFTVFGIIVLGVVLGCKTCSDPVDEKKESKSVIGMNVCPSTGTGSGDGTSRKMPAGHPELPVGHPSVKSAAKPSLENIPHFKGKVVETMKAGRYTYVSVDTGTTKKWAAAPEFKVQVGDNVIVPSGMPMKDFKSTKLKRSFDTVYFAGQIIVESE